MRRWRNRGQSCRNGCVCRSGIQACPGSPCVSHHSYSEYIWPIIHVSADERATMKEKLQMQKNIEREAFHQCPSHPATYSHQRRINPVNPTPSRQRESSVRRKPTTLPALVAHARPVQPHPPHRLSSLTSTRPLHDHSVSRGRSHMTAVPWAPRSVAWRCNAWRTRP